jgi:alpha-L-rhamnosidase
MSVFAASEAPAPPMVEAPMRFVDLRCEHDRDPLGIDERRPRFGWILGSDHRGCRQTAYRVVVASSEDRLREGVADRWDSGRVASAESVAVEYAGAELHSGERCWWRVQAWDEADRASVWSAPAWFEMGLLREEDWLGGWIGDEASAPPLTVTGDGLCAVTELPAPLLRREFRIDRELASARLYLAGLGWCEARINGQRVGERALDPAPTDYDRRVLYATYDVTPLLAHGANAIGVMLGNGWYCSAYGDSPRLRCQLSLRFRDGSTQVIAADGEWRSGDGPIQRNSISIGEVYDARREVPGWDRAGFDDSRWRRAVPKPAPGGAMVAQRVPPITDNESLRPLAVRQLAPGAQAIDFDRLFAGRVRLRLHGRPGERVAITYASRLQPDGRPKPLPRGRARDEVILRGDPAGEWWEPRFTFHPVRHVLVEGAVDALRPEDAVGVMAYDRVELAEGFACANPRFDRIHACVRQTLKNELYGIQMDCMNSEHWGWLEPASNPGTLYPRAWMPAFWEKFLDDARAAQRADGVIPDVVPAYPPKNRKTGDPCWAGNFPLVAWYVYRACEDRRVLERNYEAMARWLEHLTAIAKDGIVADGYYGDHMLPGLEPGQEEFISKETPGPLLRTAFYFADARALALSAEALGKSEDAARYAALAERIRAAYNAAWFDPAAKRYATGSQTANLASVALGLAPREHADAVIEDVARDIGRRGGRFHTGNIGTTALFETLVAHGQGELLYALVDRSDYPGWGYMLAQGATTIWEDWSGTSGGEDDRQSMAMFTTVDHFFWNDLAGIRAPDYFGVAGGGPAFAEIQIQPFLPRGLAWAGGAHRTARGFVRSRWERTARGLTLEVEIPVNATGVVHVPTLGCARPLVREGGAVVWDGAFVAGASGITAARADGEAIVVSVGSGRYRFELTAR